MSDSRADTLRLGLIVAGGLVGGMVASFWSLEPRWLVGGVGGAAGGVLGGLGWLLWTRPWPLWGRLAAIAALWGVGFFLIWDVPGYFAITDPRNIQIGSASP